MPAKDAVAKLTIKHFLAAAEEVEVPWITKDVADFIAEQQGVTRADKAIGEMDLSGVSLGKFFDWAALGLKDQSKVKPSILNQIMPGSAGYHFANSFVYVDMEPTWSSDLTIKTLRESFDAPAKTVDLLKAKRLVPPTAIFVNSDAIYPFYVTGEKVVDATGKATGETKLIATMYLPDFSPTDPAKAVKEVSDTLVSLQTLGVKDIVIDMINNGGGSLTLGLQLAQLFSQNKITAPEMQFKLSNSWLDQFETMSLAKFGINDAEKELYRRVFDGLAKDAEKGMSISSKWSTESLMPFTLKGNDRLKDKMNVVLMVNEMCASMCDMFSAIMQDNGLAQIVGAQTMGAGGNVVMHGEAPNSHMWVSQTESLVLRKDGSYIENNGIKPDVALAVNQSALFGYYPIRSAAIKLLTVKK